jgi:hypothetical protein
VERESKDRGRITGPSSSQKQEIARDRNRHGSARPSLPDSILQLTLGGDSIGDPIEVLMIHESDGTSLERITPEMSGIVLADALLELDARAADVI